MASLYKKTINEKPYWYLREMARVDGKPKITSDSLDAVHDVVHRVNVLAESAL
ncbi:hypothetical protein [Cryobacterium sp. Y62]|uniref:hypothetical protein n=1 Tax=Cryobacterium sp. Y62 TaxID=2048284 RepID=UPI001304FD59|nr:hypothetical protein [Cryobacterium sp. Y62]